jgi:hypothetical protein
MAAAGSAPSDTLLPSTMLPMLLPSMMALAHSCTAQPSSVSTSPQALDLIYRT